MSWRISGNRYREGCGAGNDHLDAHPFGNAGTGEVSTVIESYLQNC